MSDDKDKRPDVAKDDDKTPRADMKDHWKNTTDTMDEGPSGSPNATEQSRKS